MNASLFGRSAGVLWLTGYATSAAVYTWVGSISPEWNEPNNWDPIGIPGTADTVVLQSGLVETSGFPEIQRLDFSGGTLSGGGILTVSDAFHWTGGTLAGSAQTVVGRDALLLLSGPATKTMDRHTLHGVGTVRWEGTGNIRLQNAAFWHVEGVGLMEIFNDAVMEQGAGSSQGIFAVDGILKKWGGTGATRLQGIDLWHNGVIELHQGSIVLEGDYAPEAGSTLVSFISEARPGEDFGFLEVTGMMAPAGRLELALTGGYGPSEGFVFEVLRAAGRTGTFDSVHTTGASAGLAFIPEYTDTAVRVRAINAASAFDPQESRMSGGSFSGVLRGAIGQVYRIEASTNLIDWVTVEATEIPAGAALPFTDPESAALRMRFYRAVFPDGP